MIGDDIHDIHGLFSYKNLCKYVVFMYVYVFVCLYFVYVRYLFVWMYGVFWAQKLLFFLKLYILFETKLRASHAKK